MLLTPPQSRKHIFSTVPFAWALFSNLKSVVDASLYSAIAASEDGCRMKTIAPRNAKETNKWNSEISIGMFRMIYKNCNSNV